MGNQSGEKCVFCDVINGNAPAHRVYESKHALVILDIRPFAKGQCLVLPKRHVPWWHQLSTEETSDLFHVANIVANRMMKTFRPNFVHIYARGTRIPHTHIFLIPTFREDVLNRFLEALENFQESLTDMAALKDNEQMEDAARLLREAD